VTDQEKSKQRGKLLDQIRATVSTGGSDPTTNIKLGGLLTQARSSRVPKSSLESALNSAGSGSSGESVMYEGRGPSGYLILIEAVTDNRNRTRPELRHIVEKQGGVLGDPGSSAFVFDQKATVEITVDPFQEGSPPAVDPMELAIEVGAEDVDCQTDPEGGGKVIQLRCEPNELSAVCAAVRGRGLEVSSAGVDYLPRSFVPLSREQFEKAEKMVELLSEQSDVVGVYTNHELA
jgi:YebC/PmpR family DNA-binding regulatory protein